MKTTYFKWHELKVFTFAAALFLASCSGKQVAPQEDSATPGTPLVMSTGEMSDFVESTLGTGATGDRLDTSAVDSMNP
jgi:hypothetical protein